MVRLDISYPASLMVIFGLAHHHVLLVQYRKLHAGKGEMREADRQTQSGPGYHEKDSILPGHKYAFTPEANWNRRSEVFV